MRRLAPALICLPLFVAASGPVHSLQVPLDQELARARAEQRAAEAEAARLGKEATRARDKAARLKAEQAGAAQAIAAAEARISAADTELALAQARLALQRQRLAREQQPIGSLLAGLALMSARPPFLALADRSGVDELVHVRILLDSTMPVIRSRTAQLSEKLKQGERLRQHAGLAREESVRSRQDLVAKRERFAALEREVTALAQSTGSEALRAGDAALVAGETLEGLREGAGDRSTATAAALAQLGPAAPRPTRPESGPPPPSLAYQLPANAPVREGLSAVSPSGVRSRGITLATARGAPVSAPASGTVRFSGPFRDYDGVLIIDHGKGLISLLVNVASTLKPGDRVRLGDRVGRALGPLGVELSQNGRRLSPALIAGSSPTLSKATKGG